MASIFGGGTSRATQANKPAKQLRIQSSIEGKAIPIGWGRARLSGNLIWYDDFRYYGGGASGGKGGGKGGGGGGGKGKSPSQTKYEAAVVIAMTEGPVLSFDRVWNNQTLDSFSKLNLTTFLGTATQSAWSYLTGKHPEAALNYRGLSYMAAGPMKLGSSPALPNLTVEITFAINSAISGLPDANPRDVMEDFLTNAQYGAGFPASAWATNALYGNYCKATGMVVSPVLTDASEGSSFLGDLLDRTNAEAVWSGGKLTIVPYGDTAVTAYGATYTPPDETGYTFTDVDFKLPQNGGTSGAPDPVQCARKPPSDRKNMIPLEFLDRDNSYNPKIVDARDDAQIATDGLRRADIKQSHFFCVESAALMSAHLTLAREAVRNEYTFTVGQEYILIEPMDVVRITDTRLGLNATPVRIKEITENTDYTLTVLAEDFLAGSSWAPPYNTETSGGANPNTNASAGPVNPPVIWEPTYDLTNGQPEIWIAISGAGQVSADAYSGRRRSDAPTTIDYGGCEVWVSTDDQTYALAGIMDGSSRMGVLTANLPAIVKATTGPTIDQTNTLKVDLSQVPGEQLLPGTQGDALSANTLSYVDGEYLAYETASLVSGQQYDLIYLNRGLFGSISTAEHPAGSSFVRLEPDGVFRFGITADRIGQTFYFKFLSYNAWGGGKQELTDAIAYPYIVGGTPLTGAVSDVGNLGVVYVSAGANLTWDEVKDFRPLRYEIRQGTSWTAGQILGSVAHPPFRIPGNGRYWVNAYVTPTPGISIYATNPPDVLISGAVIEQNVIASFDQSSLGWPGILGGTAGVAGSSVVTTGDGDIYGVANIFALADMFSLGGQASGTYQIPASHEVLLTREAPCNVVISWSGQGAPVGQDVLSVTDWLAQTDILGFAATANTAIYPEISTWDGAAWSPWAKFAAGGAVSAVGYRARMQLVTSDPQTQVVLTGFTFAVDVPDRTDHYSSLSVGAGGYSLTFRPDGTATPAPFNGGPGSDDLPHIQGTIINAQAADQLVISNLTASGCNVQVTNGGVGVARSVNILAQGY